MSKMKELYEKVAGDSDLQAKFAEIMKGAAEEEATKEKLIAFAKEAGYDVAVEEMQAFFKGLAEAEKGELSDTELDQVAGGKNDKGFELSIITLGLGCAAVSIISEAIRSGDCARAFQ